MGSPLGIYLALKNIIGMAELVEHNLVRIIRPHLNIDINT